MAPVTEVASIRIKADVDPTAALAAAIATLKQQPGCLRIRHGPKHEDAAQHPLFIDWEDVSAHRAFMDSAPYGPFLDDLGRVLDGTPHVCHVAFDPFPPAVLDNRRDDEAAEAAAGGGGGAGGFVTAVAEVAFAYFPADIDMVQQQDILITVQQFVDQLRPLAKGHTGETAHGWVLEELDFKGEKCRTLALVIGWESVDAHMAFRDTEGFAQIVPPLRNLPGLKSMELFHVSNYVA